jgi:hypothetical protein
MPKTFYTERDIEDLARRGVRELVVNADVVLTELAREKADRLGLTLSPAGKTQPAGAAAPQGARPPETPAASPPPDLRQKVRDAVIARLGNEVDPNLLETIMTRVLDNVGIH